MTRFTPSQLSQMADLVAAGNERDWTVAKMLEQAAEDAEDAERWRAFLSAGWPVCFLGETYETPSELNEAIDTARRTQEKNA